MLSKKNRVDKKTADLIFRSGKFVGSKNLTLKFIKNDNTATKVSFIAPKSVFKKAVRRNFLRRKGYNALKKYFSKLPKGFLGMFIFNKNIDSDKQLEDEIEKIIDKVC